METEAADNDGGKRRQSFVFARIPGVNVLWPVRVHYDSQSFYCKSDDAWFPVKKKQKVETFPNDLIAEENIRKLKKLPNTLEAFMNDLKWAKEGLNTCSIHDESPDIPSPTATANDESPDILSQTAMSNHESIDTLSQTTPSNDESTDIPSQTAMSNNKSLDKVSPSAMSNDECLDIPSQTALSNQESVDIQSQTVEATDIGSQTAQSNHESIDIPSQTVMSSDECPSDIPSQTAPSNHGSIDIPSQAAMSSDDSPPDIPSQTVKANDESLDIVSQTAPSNHGSIDIPSQTAMSIDESPSDIPSQTVKANDESLDIASQTAPSNHGSIDIPSQAAMSSDESPPDIVSQSAMSSDASPDIASQTAQSNHESIDILSQTVMSSNESLDMVSQTVVSSFESPDIASQSAMSSDASLDIVSQTALSNHESIDKPSKTAMSSDESPSDKASQSAMSSDESPSDKASQSAMSSDESLDIASQTAPSNGEYLDIPSQTDISSHESPDVASQSDMSSNESPDVASQTDISSHESPDVASQSDMSSNESPDVASQSDMSSDESPDKALQSAMSSDESPDNASQSAISNDESPDLLSQRTRSKHPIQSKKKQKWKRIISIEDDSDDTDGIERKRKKTLSHEKKMIIEDSEESDQSAEIPVFPMLEKIADANFPMLKNIEDEKRDGHFARDIKNKNVYVSLTRSKDGKRVYDARHPCLFCPKTVANFSHHILSKQHESNPEVQEVLSKSGSERKTLITRLRLKAAHKRNMEVLKEKKGEIHLLRRSNNEGGKDSDDEDAEEHFNYSFDLDKYGPCPKCFGWVLLRSIKRHQKTCCAADGTVSTKTSLTIQSDIIVGKIPDEASQLLRKEVFPIMQLDNISKTAKTDTLIINLGNQWMMKNRSNEVNRKYYTSSVMRLNARLKLACQELTGSKEDMDFFLQPKYFQTVLKGSLQCCTFDDVDEEDLKAPSNAIKLGYDLKRMLDAKLATAIMHDDNKKKREAKDFKKLMDIQWSLKVTKLARSILNERSFNVTRKLPLPSDIKKLAQYLQTELKKISFEDTSYENFRKTARLAVTRITLFNRRRCHEVQAMKVSSYQNRKTGVDEMGLEIRGELTKFEQLLLEKQDMVVIRGKNNKGVPVILPNDTLRALKYLTNPEVREKAGILLSNPYVFASAGAGVFRAYDAIRSIARNDVSLEYPDLIRTSNMRKYMATMLQALNTTECERQWVLDHLGHTLNVHKIHYRMTSDILERVDVAKILLLQDSGKMGKYHGKSLKDIQLEELLAAEVEADTDNQDAGIEADDTDDQDTGIEADEALEINKPSSGDQHYEEDYIPDLDIYEDESEEELERDEVAKEKQKKKKTTTRQKWTEEEVEELKELFKTNLNSLKLPGQQEIENKMKRSQSKGGVVHKRKRDTIKKKLSNMIIKIKKSK